MKMKLAQCISQCKFLNHSITFIHETHIFGQSTTMFDDQELFGWTFVNSGLKSKASAGVGIALSQDVKLIDIDDTILDFRIILVRIILQGILKYPHFVLMLLQSYMRTPPKKSFLAH